ncbi:MAG: invasion associated locus B family protein [Alphaproteobacteria bacterium]|nr:invasion associated locus B family protein [Alphaproteobacteria bacterium]
MLKPIISQLNRNLCALCAVSLVCGFIGQAIVFVSVALVPTASAAQPKLLGTYKAWRVFENGESVTKTCYAITKPATTAPRNVRRGEIFMAITHRPGQGVRNEVSVRIGYPFSQKSKPFARIGQEDFQFFTGAQTSSAASAPWAWMVNIAHHAPMVEAMKRGTTLTFKGTSARGTLTTDRYSLYGFTAAMAALDKACPQ